MATECKSTIKDATSPIRRVGNGGGHHFFGYYNKTPWDPSDRFLLANRFADMDARLAPDLTLNVGYFDMAGSQDFKTVGQTTAWNWQMGCQLQWLGNGPMGSRSTELIYNIRDNEPRGRYAQYGAVIHNIETGADRHLEDPIYSVAPNGAFALSVDYNRLFVTHETIGYAQQGDEPSPTNCPSDDGLRVVDLTTGESKLLLSYADLRAFHHRPSMDAAIHWISHIEVNPASSRIVFLHRWTERVEDETCFLHRLITVDPDGRNLRLLECSDHPLPQLSQAFDPDAVGTFDYEKDAYQISHPLWMDDDHVIAWGPHKGGTHYHLYHDVDGGDVRIVGGDVLNENGHMSFSPVDKRWMLTDTYPDDQTSIRQLMLYDLIESTLYTIGEFFTPDLKKVSRCDLHPRWNHSGDAVCIDSVHEGERQMYVIDVSDLVLAKPTSKAQRPEAVSEPAKPPMPKPESEPGS